jgi:hypothetical protein
VNLELATLRSRGARLVLPLVGADIAPGLLRVKLAISAAEKESAESATARKDVRIMLKREVMDVSVWVTKSARSTAVLAKVARSEQ